MPKLSIGNKPDMTADKLLEIFKKQFGGKYEVYKTKLIGADIIVKKSGWTGVAIKILQSSGQTILRFNAMSPSALVRVLQLGLIPLLFLYFGPWGRIVAEVEAFIKGSSELK
ncbi:MAG: hypothetical protein RDV41_04375 [Planctomycetota bacterium]|nr:hypothetical protein [Planctomycetota bacterium]